MTTTTTAPPIRKDATVWVEDPEIPGAVSLRFPGEWTVETINPKTCRLSQPAEGAPGGRRYLKCDRTLIATVKPAGTPGVIPYRTPFRQGQVVRWTQAPPEAGQTLFVVIRDGGLPLVERIVPLGGTAGRYWGRVPAAELTLVPLDGLLSGGQAR